MKNYEEITNTKKNINIICEDFLYNKDKRIDGSTKWRCVSRTCSASGFVDYNDKFVIIKAHNHNKLTNRINRLKFNNKIISDSLLQIKTATDIITSNTAELSNADLKSIPDYKSLNDKISRIRNEKCKD
ncbi:hypothetical protein CDIK_1904, partial [Cucumispora dikerogammari]